MLIKEITMSTELLGKKMNQDLLGAGAQGIAFKKSSKINTITKFYGLNSLSDPYYRFINTIEHYQDNPFFPKIHDHEIYEHKKFKAGSQLFKMTGVVVMEKLIPLNSSKLDYDHVIQLFHNLGIDIIELSSIGFALQDTNKTLKLASQTSNEQFKEALEVLAKISRSYDLHAGNWMIRPTSTGPQLVILDPVYDPYNLDEASE